MSYDYSERFSNWQVGGAAVKNTLSDSTVKLPEAPTTVYVEEVGELEVLSLDDPTEDDIISLIFG